MKIQEVILRAMAKKITLPQAAEIIGISDRQTRRGFVQARMTLRCARREEGENVQRAVATDFGKRPKRDEKVRICCG